ncbi:hypothetical protein ACA040_002570 [Xenophilus aerolatus]
MFKSPATVSPQVFQELEQLFATVDSGVVPDAFQLARIRRDAINLEKVEPVAGHIVHSALAALAWDVDAATHHVECAMKEDDSLATFYNAVVTFEFLNRSDLAKPYALRAAAMAPHDEETIHIAVSALLSSGEIQEAARLQRSVEGHLAPSIDVVEIEGELRKLGVEESHVQDVLAVARNVLTAANKRVREVGVYRELDPDGGSSVAFELGFFGSLDDEFRMDYELCDKLGELVDWDPTRMTVHLNHLAKPVDAHPAH